MEGLVLKVILVLLIANAVLSGLSVALEKIKDLTKTEADNKAYAVISKIADVLKKVTDFVSANRPNSKV